MDRMDRVCSAMDFAPGYFRITGFSHFSQEIVQTKISSAACISHLDCGPTDRKAARYVTPALVVPYCTIVGMVCSRNNRTPEEDPSDNRKRLELSTGFCNHHFYFRCCTEFVDYPFAPGSVGEKR